MENYFGDIQDIRSEEEKAQDYKHSDLGYGLPDWKKKDIKDLKSYTKRYQNGALTCGGQAGAKAVETIIGKVVSALPPYIARINSPDGGMYIQDLGNTFKKIGTALEELYPSQNMGEKQSNIKLDVLTPYKIKGYLFPNTKKIDEIAQAIDAWGHCILLVHGNGNEWSGKPVFNNQVSNFGHYITAVDYFLDENRVKCLYIEDSSMPTTSLDGQGHRIITEDYLLKRFDGSIYFTGVNPLELPYVFTKTLRLGSRGLDVKMLQSKLGKITTDGIFGPMTKLAVQAFQLKNNLVPDGIAGPKTFAVINS